MITLVGRTEYKDLDSKRKLAEFLTSLIEGNRDTKFVPHNSTEDFWTINSGNNWKLQFFPDEPKKFGIIYRYENGKHETAFANWLCVRMINVSICEN